MRLFSRRAKPKGGEEDKERMPEANTEAAPSAPTDVPNAEREAGTDAATSDTTSSITAPAATPEPDTNEAETAADSPEETPPPQDNLLAQIGAEACLLVLAEITQVVPHVQAGVVAIVEGNAHRIGSDRLQLQDPDVLLAWYGHALRGAMSLYLSARTEHPQGLRRQIEQSAIVE